MPVTREAIARLPIVIYPKNYFMNKTFHAYFAPVLEKETPVISARLSTPYAMVYYCQQNGAERSCRSACLIYKKNSPKIDLIRDYVSHVLQSFDEGQDSIHREKR